MHVEIAFYLLSLHKVRFFPVRVDLLPAFSELRRNKRQTEVGVKRFFARECFDVSCFYGFYSVFTDPFTALFRQLAHFNVVIFRTGKMMQCGGKLFLCHKPEIHTRLIFKGQDD